MTWTERDERMVKAWNDYDDETFLRLLAESNLESAFRPRDEFDIDLHPDSLRAHILANREAWERVPRWLRILSRFVAWRPWR